MTSLLLGHLLDFFKILFYKGTLMHWQWDCKLVQTLWRFLKKLKVELTALWPNDPTFWYLSKKSKNINSKRLMPLHSHCSIIYNSQDMETTWTSINKWMSKENVMYISNGILHSHKKKEILPTATTWMVFKGIMLSEISQTEKNKYYMISPTCGI